MKTLSVPFFSFVVFCLTACASPPSSKQAGARDSSVKLKVDTSTKTSAANAAQAADTAHTPLKEIDPAAVMAKTQVPILCYHHIRNSPPQKKSRDYEVSPAQFAEQMKALSDAGYTTILPDQLYNYLVNGAPIPAKSIMLTFDDTDAEQFFVGKTEMDKYKFKGVFFIMTISINRPHYLTKEQIKQLSDEGHSIQAHTWDHHMVTKYTPADWVAQLDKPRKKLEDMTGKKIVYFAYPFGLWNRAAEEQLKKEGIKMAFQLSLKRDTSLPLYSIRRILVPGTWSTPRMMKAITQSFN